MYSMELCLRLRICKMVYIFRFLKSKLSSQLAEAARFIANLAISADSEIFKRLEIIDPVQILLNIVRNEAREFDDNCVNQARMALLQLCRRGDFQSEIEENVSDSLR